MLFFLLRNVGECDYLIEEGTLVDVTVVVAWVLFLGADVREGELLFIIHYTAL
jgi:hypothetical protein